MKRPETLVDRLRQGGRKVDAILAADAIDAALIDHLMSEFPDIPDRKGLIDAIERTAYAYEGHLRAHPTERCWQDLYDTTQRVLGLIRGMRPAIIQRLGPNIEFGERAPERLDELMKTLAIVGKAGGLWVGQRGPGRNRKDAARAMLSVLANYWVYEVGQKFTQDNVWPKGERGDEPPTEATRFAYAVIEYLVPGEGQSIKSIAKEFTWIPPLS